MAPTNPGYSKNASDIKDAVIAKLASSRDTYLTITDTFIRIEDIWLGILRDDFVYGFRNSLELKAYNTVERRYQEIVRDMANFFYEYLIQKAKTVIGGNTAEKDLDYQVEQVIKKLQKDAEDKLTSCIIHYEEFIKESDLKDVMLQWSSTRKTQLKLNKDSHLTETEKEIADLKTEQKEAIIQSKEKIKYESELNERARQVAIELQGKEADDETIINKFEDIWSNFFQSFSSSFKELEDTNFVEKKIELFVSQIKRPVLGLIKEPKKGYDYEHMTCLFGSMDSAIFKIGEHIDVFTPEDILADCRKYQESAVDIKDTIFQRIDNELYRITSEDRRFNVKCLSDIIKIIDEIIDDHNAKNYKQLNFNLMNPYNALVTTHVVRYITIFLTRNEQDYIKRHSLRCRLKNYKETALELFRGVVAKETEDMTAANFFQKELVEKVTERVLDLIPLNVHRCMLKKYHNRKFCVMKEVMKDLARKKDFNNCDHYIMDPISFVEKWLTENMLATIFDKKQSGVSEYEKFVNRYIKYILDETKNKTQMTTQQCKRFSQLSIKDWIKRFCTNLSSSKILPVSEDLFVHVTKREKTDIFNFEATVINKFNQMENLIRDKFRETTSQSVKWRKNPIPGLMSALWGCKAKCPLCFEPCKNINPNHLNEKIRHQCLQHRVQGLNGRHWKTSQRLLLNFCNTGIQENVMKFQNYQVFHPEWYIEPTMNTSKYWIWLLCHFKQEFEARHGKKFVDIPPSWKRITEDEALDSLEETDDGCFPSSYGYRMKGENISNAELFGRPQPIWI